VVVYCSSNQSEGSEIHIYSRHAAVCCSVLQCVAVRCSPLQSVAVCCSSNKCGGSEVRTFLYSCVIIKITQSASIAICRVKSISLPFSGGTIDIFPHVYTFMNSNENDNTYKQDNQNYHAFCLTQFRSICTSVCIRVELPKHTKSHSHAPCLCVILFLSLTLSLSLTQPNQYHIHRQI